MSLEQLLAHRSGIGDYRDEDELADNNDYVMTVPVHELATTEQYIAGLWRFMIGKCVRSGTLTVPSLAST